jgi:PAS domain S-box-containing protein
VGTLQWDREVAERLFQTAQGIIVVLDLDGRVIRFSPSLEELSGYGLTEAQGQDWVTTFLPERDWHRGRAVFAQMPANPLMAPPVIPIVTRDGRERQVEWRTTTLNDAAGRPAAILATGQDVTGQRRAEEELQRYQALADRARDIVLFVRPDGRILEANRAAAAAYGYSKEELEALQIQDLRAPETHSLTAQQMAQADAEGILFETVHRRKDGSTFPVEVSACDTTLEGERVLFSIVRDITERKRTDAALRTRTQQLEAIQAVGEEMTRELDLPTLLRLIHRRVTELLGSGMGTVFLWDESDQALIPRAMHGKCESARDLRLQLGEGVAGTVAQRREGLIVNDFRTSPYVSPALLERTSHVGVIAEPLIYQGRLLGAVSVDNPDPERRFTTQDQQLLRLFAGQAAIAVANARLHEDAARRGAERLALLAATRSVMSGLQLQEILNRIATEASRISGCPHVKLLLVDPEAGVLRVGVLRGRAHADGFPLPLGVGLSGQVAATGEPLYLADTQADPRSVLAAQDRALGLRTYLGLPIKLHTQVLGVLTFNTTTPHEYTPDELAYLTAFADQAAIAIANAQHYAAAQARADEQETFREIERAMMSRLELPAVLEAVVAGTTRLLSSDFAQVVLWDEATGHLRFGAALGPEAERVRQQTFELGRGINGVVAQRRQPMILNDYSASPYAVPECADVVATITVPICFGERLLGVLHSHTTHPGQRYTTADLNRVQLLASQAAVAIENARLYQNLEDELTRGRAMETQLRLIARVVEQSPNIVVITDASGTIEYVNPAFTQVTGYTPEEAIGQNPRILKTGHTAPETYKDLWTTIRAGKEWRGVFLNKKKNGELFWEAASVSPVRDPEGTVTHFVAVKEDFTRRKGTEDALAERTRQLEVLRAVSAEITRELDLSTLLELINRRVGELVGSSAGTVYLWDAAAQVLTPQVSTGREGQEQTRRLPLGEGLVGLVAARRGGMIINNYRQWAHARPEILTRTRITAAVAEPLLYHDHLVGVISLDNRNTGRPFTQQDGELLRLFAAQAAIAIENARLFAELQRSQETLRQAQKLEAIGQLAGGIAHDFNNLLTVINGYSQMLLMRLPPEDRSRGKVEEILQAGERAAGLTQQLLAFSRKQVLQPRVLDLNDRVLDLQKMLRRLIGEDIALEACLSQPLGRVHADPGQIEQVIINLAVNARDAMPRGGSLQLTTANVTLDDAAASAVGLPPGAYAHLSVADTGCGMTPEVMERIFEPFFTTKGDGKGTGLGLSTVYGIIHQSGGSVTVQSRPGHGATFTIYLPIVEEPVEEPTKAAPLEPLRGGGETVLVVEDAGLVRRLAAEILADQGYRVVEAESAEQALDVLHASEPGAVRLMLTDIVLPGMNGLDLSRRVAAEHPAVKVILMSGYTDHSLLQEGALDSNLPFLHKPFTPSGLLQKVQAILKGEDGVLR